LKPGRTTKLLLLLIGLGLWAVAFAHFLAPTPAVAQSGPVPVDIQAVGGMSVMAGSGVPVVGTLGGRAVRVEGKEAGGALPVTGTALQRYPLEVTVAR